MHKPRYIIVHHTGGTNADPLADSSNYTFKQCDADHKASFNLKSSLGFYCGYQYYIDKKGIVTQARLDTETGAHTIGFNTQSIGICLAGNFDLTMPLEAQKQSLRTLLTSKCGEYSIPLGNVVPHRAFATKTCYGKKLPENWARELIHAPKHVFAVDMEYGDTSFEVRELQKRLQELGYFPQKQPLTEYYGPITRGAVFAFQQEHVVGLSWMARYVYKGRYFARLTRDAMNKL